MTSRCTGCSSDYLAQLWRIARESGNRDRAAGGDGSRQARVLERASLATSLERRLAGLAGEIDGPAQVALPFGFEDDASDEAELPIRARIRTDG